MTGELSRVLSKRDVFVLALGAMIGWGWIVQTGYFIDQSGVTGAISAFVLGGFMVSVVSLIYGELASAMPFVGGEHVYSMRALGPAGSFVCTWAIIFGYISVVAFEAVALPSALAYIVPGFNVFELWTVAGQPVYGTWVATGVIGSVVITYLNYRGVRPAAQFQAILALVITLSGLTLLLGALFNGTSPSSPPLAGAGIGGVFTVAIMTPFMFVGFDVIPQAAGEADVSPKLLGGLIGLSVACAAAFYIAVIWAAGQVATGATLVESSLPAATAMEIAFDSATIGRIMALAGLAGILTSWNGFVLGASRAIYAMADSNMLPERLATIHDDHDTPSTAIVLVGGLAALAPLFGEQMLVWVVNAGGLGMVTAWRPRRRLVPRAPVPRPRLRPAVQASGGLRGRRAQPATDGVLRRPLPPRLALGAGVALRVGDGRRLVPARRRPAGRRRRAPDPDGGQGAPERPAARRLIRFLRSKRGVGAGSAAMRTRTRMRVERIAGATRRTRGVGADRVTTRRGGAPLSVLRVRSRSAGSARP
nr:APC family permease [Haloferax sp. ATB1]